MTASERRLLTIPHMPSGTEMIAANKCFLVSRKMPSPESLPLKMHVLEKKG
jgi:hypothetical protein